VLRVEKKNEFDTIQGANFLTLNRHRRNRMMRSVKFRLICAFACMLVSAAVASEYRFVVSGVPVQDASYSAYCEIAELVTGGKSVSVVNPEEYDARCRTISISDPGNLLTTKRIGFHMILR
jgi:hypothetical protein